MITEPVQLALVVAVPTFVAPIVLLVANRWLDRGDKQRQYAREDEVKKQVAEVATQAAEAASLLKTATRAAAADSAEIKVQVKAVHTLVNSDKTALIEFNLASLEGQLAALVRLEALGRKLNPPVESTNEETSFIDSLRVKIDTLRQTLKERAEQTLIVKQQLAQGHADIAADTRTAAATERVADETKRIADAAEEKR